MNNLIYIETAEGGIGFEPEFYPPRGILVIENDLTPEQLKQFRKDWLKYQYENKIPIISSGKVSFTKFNTI